MFFIVYARIIDDKHAGVKLGGVYFGGTAETFQEAEEIAKDCVNTIKGGTVIPKIYDSHNKRLLPIMLEAQEKFQKLEEQMLLAQDIMTRNTRRR